MPTVDELRRLFEYNGEFLIWKHRENVPNNWNSKYAGKRAGSLDKKGYAIVQINSRPYKAHRIIWALVHGDCPRGHLDHVNGDRADNRIENIRLATPSQNMQNRKNYGLKNQFPKGVAVSGKKYKAMITWQGKRHYLGTFDTPIAAHSAYCAAADQYFGSFSNHG